MTKIVLDGNSLTEEMFVSVVYGGALVTLSAESQERVRRCRDRIEEIVRNGDVVYGVNTGFGKLSDVVVPSERMEELQENLIRSHAVGVGKPFSTLVVRGMLLLRANALAKGHSGIREETLLLLVDMLNHGVHPFIPSQGSLGASGDLAPLAHIALVLLGEGEAEFQGERLGGAEALTRAGLKPVRLHAKEGLALINGTQAMTSVGLVGVHEAAMLGRAANAAASLTIEALRGIGAAFDDMLMELRPHKDAGDVAASMRNDLTGSRRVSQPGELRVQDAYSIRCIPQVHGASWGALQYARQQLAIEMNSATDNPLVLADGRVVSGGHFHGQPIALAMDFLKLAVAEWANISERRCERLVNPTLSGNKPFLANQPGVESGLMIAQYVAASLVSENKVLAHPASVDSIPSSANQEDHVSMGTIAARQMRDMVQNAIRVIAIECICASQSLYLDGAEVDVSPVNRKRLEAIRSICPPLQRDESISQRIEELAQRLLHVGLDA